VSLIGPKRSVPVPYRAKDPRGGSVRAPMSGYSCVPSETASPLVSSSTVGGEFDSGHHDTSVIINTLAGRVGRETFGGVRIQGSGWSSCVRAEGCREWGQLDGGGPAPPQVVNQGFSFTVNVFSRP
jgi:hypothetical protein